MSHHASDDNRPGPLPNDNGDIVFVECDITYREEERESGRGEGGEEGGESDVHISMQYHIAHSTQRTAQRVLYLTFVLSSLRRT